MSNKTQGSNDYTNMLLNSILQFLENYKPPSDKALVSDLEYQFTEIKNFFMKCRSLTAGAENALKFVNECIKQRISKMSDEKAIQWLIQQITKFQTEKVKYATQVIETATSELIQHNDVILIYVYSSRIENALVLAKEQKKEFQVIIVDSRPGFTGRKYYEVFKKNQIEFKYTLLPQASNFIQQANKVMIAPYNFMQNGYMKANVGTAMICCLAKYYLIPVIALCETYKFSEKTQLDAMAMNEVLDPSQIRDISIYPGDGREQIIQSQQKNLNILNIGYDLTPAEYIDLIITEVGQVPPTSIPAVIREIKQDIQEEEKVLES